ncbi:RrF2 family transcriptional regulator [Rhodococcoides yunnanense]|uniref:RrF2 family transcriptional regulator n=1 Tax=Rhodococcoides yunnanense TaxID=278209 RepID=UPI0009332357|nr:Rrf2 family transcriptional regulator [Rhodococcus yunnanensis]
MQLTRFSDLALRAMMLLASAGPDRRVTTGSIAVHVNASEHHVAKAVTRLVGLQCVRAVRGRSGGLFLTEHGRSMRVGTLIRQLENDREVVDCIGDRPCPLIAACRLRRALDDAKEAFYSELDRHTIDDLATSPLLQLTITSPK